MDVALVLLVGVVLVTAVAAFGERVGWSAPLLLVAAGIVVSFVPGTPTIDLDPDVVLYGLLPPLLYSAAIRTSLVDFRANRRAILLLSVGLVAFATVVVGLVAWWVVPSITIAAAFAIGAVVAPPDAVAASAIARNVAMPRRIVGILEGESLVNDATALVALSTATAALTRSVTPWEVGWRLVLAAGGGIVVGLGVALVLAFVRKHIDDPVYDTTLSFAAPFAAFLPAEAIHASGVLSVVVTGLALSHRSSILQSASSRIAENTNWGTIAFLLENGVFLLIGLQLRGILDDVQGSHVSFATAAVSCVAILAATIVSRLVWVLASTGVLRSFGRETAWSWSAALIVGWSGMRGVVTLAAVFLLPEETPQRSLLRLAAFVVVAGTLVLQGLSLPWLVRRLRLPGPDQVEDALQTAALVTDATRAGLRRLDELASDDDPPAVLAQLRERADRRSDSAWERLGRAESELETPSATYRRLRLQMLAAERQTILEARATGTVDEVVLRGALGAIDIEESLLDRVSDATARLEGELVAPAARAGGCRHLREAPTAAVGATPGACKECLEEGTRWVHLRMCLSCGHVGCCDSSEGRHAERHHHETRHPVMRSVEPGEAWRWCYDDRLLG
jgi:monovalent cation/hydrogen antiporter